MGSDLSDVEVDASEAPREEQTWTEVHSDIQIEPFVSPVGPNFEAFVNAKEIDYFCLLFGDDILIKIVDESNRFARQKLADKPEKRWVDITLPELKAYLGISIIMGINYNPRTAMYWSADEFYCNPGIKKVMPRNRFDEIKRFLHFSDSSKQMQRGEEGYDRLYKVRCLLEHCKKTFKDSYNPSKNLSVDEGMIAFKGRLSFRQYMPAKPTKYGIKVWMCADSATGYVLNHEVYLGKDKDNKDGVDLDENGLGHYVVTSMTKPFHGRYHHVYFDNFFNSPKLLQDLLGKKTYACGTVRSNRKGLPPKKKLGTGEIHIEQKGNTNLVYTQWKDKRDVAVLSTNCSPKEQHVTTQRRGRGGVISEVVKPKVVAMYNNNMGGVDQADQIRSYYPTGRASRKWYRYIFWFLFDVAIGNAFVLDKISATGRRRPKKGLEFRDHLAKQLIGGYVGRADVRRRESQKRALTVDISPENAAHHFIAKIA